MSAIQTTAQPVGLGRFAPSLALEDGAGEVPPSHAILRDLFETTKPRIGALVLVTTLVGFTVAATGAIDPGVLIATLLGTGLTAGGGSALNQFLEREADALMERTANRPLPSGRVTPEEVLGFGGALALVGLFVLGSFVNPLTAWLGLVSAAGYLFLYTPLKRRTPWNTHVGAVFGALPPVMGWTAARGGVDAGAWVLFGILFLWQIPHFMAIALLHREDYARGGFRMLPVVEGSAPGVARQIRGFSLALVSTSLLPVFLGLAGGFYLSVALAAGTSFAAAGFRTARNPGRSSSRQLLLVSLIYLPAVLLAMMIDGI